MADAPSTLPRKARSAPRFNLLNAVAGAFFVMAVAAAAYPAFSTGPIAQPGFLLLLGLAAVALVGVFAFGGTQAAPPPPVEPGRDLIDALAEPAAVVAPDGRVLRSNTAWTRLFGEAARLPKDPESAGDLYAAFGAARRGAVGRARLPSPQGERPVGVTPLGQEQFLIRQEPRPPAAAAVQALVPERVATAVAATPALDAFAAVAPFGAAALSGPDPFEAPIIQANGALVAMSKGRVKPGTKLGELLDPAAVGEARTRLQAKRGGPVEVRLTLDPPRTAHLYVGAVEGGLVIYLLDVSEQKQLELQLSQAHKMQAIGQLAGGVAHDFNNLLTAIQLRLDELLHRHPVGDPSYEGLNEIRQTALRAADLVRKLLAFSRKSTLQREVLDLGELISEFEVLLRRLLREDVKLETDYGRDLPLVRADKSQLETAVMNLAVNARDAMRAQGGGVVRIRTARLTQAEARELGYDVAVEGQYALIEVGDTGPGIPPEAMAKIFEPFFTTKPVGEGTGLGLATVYGIVKQADGWIHVDSQPGQGATFRIFLPVHTPAAGAAPAPRAAAKAKPVARDLSGAGRILFVEDEDAVRGVAARLLRARGYEVLEAADGEEALVLAQSNAGKIDLLISDVIMPGMDGPTLLKRARQYLGTAPVMFISGYAEAEFSDLLEGETGVSFLPKPLDIKILAERVKLELAA